MKTKTNDAGSIRLLHRLTAALLALVLAASVALPVLAADEDNNTIYINSVSDLQALADRCSYDQWSKGKTVVLQEDLSLENVAWEPIPSFSGTFLGNGHTIEGMELTGPYSPAGFFGVLEEGASVQNLTIKGVVTPAGTQKTAGGIVGVNNGVLMNCTFSGVVNCEEEAGGLVGRNETNGTIDHSTSRAVVSGVYATGGIVGRNLGTVTGCTNVGTVNAEYQESSLDVEGFPAAVLELVKEDLGEDLNQNITNVSSDTGGIAGRSSGLILSSANVGDVGYARIGYNIGGIVGRTDGLVSGCVNQGLVQGRKDVGGIAGQAEPYIALDLDESTVEKLRKELDTLHGLINGAADDMDSTAGLLNQDLTSLSAQTSTAIDAAKRLQDQGSDYLDDVADEVDRTGDLISDTFTRLEPVMDTGADALEKMSTAVGQLKWVTAEIAAEMLTASTALAKASAGADKASDALDSTKQGFEQIKKGLDDLKHVLPGQSDDSGLGNAISSILGGYSQLPGDAVDDHIKTAISLLQVANTAMSVLSVGTGMSSQMKLLTTGLSMLRSATLLSDDAQLASAGKQVSRAVGNMAGLATQISALLSNTALAVSGNGNTQMASALTAASSALSNVSSKLDGLEEILDKLGFNTGNIHAGAGSIQDGLTSLSDASKDLSKAVDDFNKSLDILKTDAALTSATLGHMSASLGIMSEGMKGLTDMTSQAADIVHWLADQDPIHMPRPSSEMSDSTDALFDAMTNITNQMSNLNADMLSSTNQATSNIRAISNQVNVVTGLLLDTVEEITDLGNKKIFDDNSEELVAQNEGKLEGCTNRGTVEADVNVGGVVGTMAVENTLDPEDDDKDDNGSLLRTEYTISAVVLNCINEGNATAKKEVAGGIVGEMDLGFANGCQAYGNVQGPNKVGGIAGHASASLRGNWAKCSLNGNRYVGGIVGQGFKSILTGNSCLVKDNRAMVEIDAVPKDDSDDNTTSFTSSSDATVGQYWGAISGGQDGDFEGNLFVSDSLRGIDRVSRSGQAEPISYDAMLALDNVPHGFQKLKLTFMADGHILSQQTFDYGASFGEEVYPVLPQKDGYFAQWSTLELDNLHLDTVVTAEYTPYVPALPSTDARENGHPIFYVEGKFGGNNALNVTAQTPDSVMGASEQWLLDFSDDGQETHTIRYLPESKTGTIYVRQTDGSWNKVEMGSFGSYLTFTAAGTQVAMAFVPKQVPIWAICLVVVVVLLLLFFLLKKLRTKRAARKAAKKNDNAKIEVSQDEDLETKISSEDSEEKTH